MLSKLFLRTFKSVDELAHSVGVHQLQQRVLKARESIQIAVIDDEGFPPIDNLRNNHYRITLFDDVNNINQLENYPIILCDLKGVGAQLNPTLQGAHLIREIKEHYYDKYVVAYTGGSEDKLIQEGILAADQYIAKDSDITTWCQLLDNAIRELVNPVIAWKKFRHRLLDHDVSPIDLACLEDAYVRSYSRGAEEAAKSLNKRADELGLKGDARSIINSLIASGIFILLFG